MNASPTDTTPTRPLVLGSSSPYRQALLRRLGLDFITASPDIDERRADGEPPQAFVTRLAREKAQAVAARHPDALIIGSDQVASIDDRILGKPGDKEKAIAQLSEASGKRVSFFTGLCLLDAASGRTQAVCEPFYVYFRNLDEAQIERYLEAEKPYNCAGSFQSEGLGIALFRRLEGEDPNALIGLPLIRLIEMLGNEGIVVP